MISWIQQQHGIVEMTVRETWRNMIWEAAGYTPTEMQADFLLDPIRVKQMSGGVRAGKSITCARAADWFTCIPNGLIWIVGPDFAQARNEFRYLLEPYRSIDGLVDEAYVSMPKDRSWRFKVNGGATIETKSAAQMEKIAGEAPDFILITEAGQHDSDIYEKSLERALEKNCPIVFSGTFEGAFSWYADQWLTWQAQNPLGAKSYSLPTWSNTYIFPDGQDDPRFIELRKSMDEDVYKERIEAVPYKPSGLVFRNSYDPERHLVPLKYNPNLPLEIATDPATHTYPILFVQWDNDRVYVLDEIYGFDKITQQMMPRLKAHPLFHRVTGGVIDVASRQRQANYSVVTLWNKYAGLSMRASSVGIQQGIDALALRLGNDSNGVPRLLINEKMRDVRRNKKGKAGGLIGEFGMYQWGKQKPNSNTKRTPIDANNDGVKALSYWLVDRYGDDVLRDWMTNIEQETMTYPWMQLI